MASENKALTLDTGQMRAVECQDAIQICIASAGSGKSRALVEKVRHNIVSGADPSAIVCLSYTNAAAKVISDRLTPIRLGYLGTLHGFLLKNLQRYGSLMGYKEGAISIMPEDARDEMLVGIAERIGVKVSKKALMKESNETRLIWADYRHTLKRTNVVDFDSILTDGLALIGKLKEAGTSLRITHLLIDEAQDSSEIDWRIYDALPAETKFIVGDVNQAIFGWRGSAPELFLEQSKRCEPLTLTHNYRSFRAICEAANCLIEHNESRSPIEMQPVATHHGHVTYLGQFPTEPDEIRAIAAEIHLTEGSSRAVLLRSHALVSRFAAMLSALGVRVNRHRKVDLPLDWTLAITLLSMWMNPGSELVVKRVLKLRGVKPTEVRDLADRATVAKQSLAQFATAVGVLPSLLATTDVSRVAACLAPWGVSEEACALIETRVRLLPQSDPSFSDLCDDLWNHSDWSPEETKEAGVDVLTCHSAKGREWDNVLLPAWDQGTLPHKGSDETEERRLAYVSITRARHGVWISTAKQRTTPWGQMVECEPSRFIREAGLVQ